MLYNTQQTPLRMKAYGREIQQMVDHALSLADRAERQAYAERIMVVMKAVAQVANPTQEESDKLWNHLAQLSNYQLDIDYPCVIEPRKEEERPARLAYPQRHPRLRHYGITIESLLNKAAEKADASHKRLGIVAAARRMRTALYEVRGDMPDDARIAHDIEFLTNGLVSQQEALELIS